MQHLLIFIGLMFFSSINGYSQLYAVDSIAIPFAKKTNFNKIAILKVVKNDTIIVEEVYLNKERKVFKRISRQQYDEDLSTLILTYDSLERVAEELKLDLKNHLIFKRKWCYKDSTRQYSVTTNAMDKVTERVSYLYNTHGDTFSLTVHSNWPENGSFSFERFSSIQINDSITLAVYSELDVQGNIVTSKYTYRKVIDSLGFKTVTEGIYDDDELFYDDPYLFENYNQNGKLIKTSSNGSMPYTTYSYSDSLNVRISEETWDWKYVSEDETEVYLVDRIVYIYNSEGILINMKSENVEYYFNYSN